MLLRYLKKIFYNSVAELREKIKKCIGENFKTNTGKRIAYNRFILD